MVAVKAHQAVSFLKALSPNICAVLIFGTDSGLVSERARLAAERLAGRDNPPGEILRIDDADLDQDPDRLAVELQTVAMFGGRKVIRSKASRKVNAALLKPLLVPGALIGSLVVDAENLRPEDALRQLFERAPNAAAIACYSDEARDLDTLVRDVLKEAGLGITPEARQILISRLGADRAWSRSEIDKLVLYAHGKGEIGVAEVEAVVGDVSESAIDSALLTAMGGDARSTLDSFDRLMAVGESPQTVILAAQRHLQRLHRIRAALDTGKSFDDATRALRPPLYFKQKATIEAQSRAWSLASLARALEAVATAAYAARLGGTLETALAERLLLDLAAIAMASRQSRR